MKHFIKLLTLLCCFSLATASHAQENKDSRYLAGAVPEVDGEVVFSKEFSIPGMSQADIYARLKDWMTARMAKNENKSRVVYAEPEKGQIAAIGEEWIVFSSSALALDRTLVSYRLIAYCHPEKCQLTLGKIRYSYRDGEEHYEAEEWITDKYALNKSKTKLVRGLAKWRRKTVDFADNLFLEAADALRSNTPAGEMLAGTQPEKEHDAAPSGATVIVPDNQVSGQQDGATAYKAVEPAQLSADLIQTGSGKLVISIGDDPFNKTVMTANAGGSLGKLDGKAVVFTILSPEQPYEALEKAGRYTVSFYPNGSTQPTVVLECQKRQTPAATEGMPRTYIGEIVKAQVKE